MNALTNWKQLFTVIGRVNKPRFCVCVCVCVCVYYTERKKKRRVNFIPKFHSSLKMFVKYFTMITKRYMYGTKVQNFIGLWSTSLELLKFSGAMLLFARKSWQTRATCGRALSCCRIRLRCCTSGTATGRKISSLYLTDLIWPQ